METKRSPGEDVFATRLPSPTSGLSKPAQATLDHLVEGFGQPFTVVETLTGDLVHNHLDDAPVDLSRWVDFLDAVGRAGRVELLLEEGPVRLLAVALPTDELIPPWVATTLLLTDAEANDEAISAVAPSLGVDPARLRDWLADCRVWPEHAATPLAEAIQAAEVARDRAASAECQLNEVSAQLLSTFEELHLIHQLTECLSVGHATSELVERSVEWLAQIVPCETVVASLRLGDEPFFFESGDASRLTEEGAPRFFDLLGPQAARRALVLNRDRTASPIWHEPGVRELVSAPILANGRPIGWVAALNYREKQGRREGTFGTVEASLLSSVTTLLGVHAGNRGLFEEGSALFQGVVHALTSAIDAKDRYTSGHSDRVARIAVRLAEQLGCDPEEINTIYLGGLLHDVGKIGIDDAVLRKPDSLTEEEFAQIRTHPELGEQILRDVPQLAHILPIVRHHHERWDGKGYPARLTGEDSPRAARITAVADAIDAMGRDRSYRQGMSIERVEQILRDGAGSQWDPEVIDAYFAAREDIARIGGVEREPLDLGAARWAIGNACPVD